MSPEAFTLVLSYVSDTGPEQYVALSSPNTIDLVLRMPLYITLEQIKKRTGSRYDFCSYFHVTFVNQLSQY